MFVPCPQCGFLVALIVAQGGQAQHCPRCKQSLDSDFDESESESAAFVASDPSPASDDTGQLQPATATATSVDPPKPSGATPGLQSAAATTAASARPPRRPRKHRAPSFVRIAAPAGSATAPRWPERLALTGLVLLLGVQLLLAQRYELAMSERWRPLIGGACAALRCELPPWREPAAYTMLARSVQPAERAGVLSVTASFRNDARWPQPWPALSLSLSDVRGQPVAQRTFVPGEYRGGDAATQTPIAPGQSASVQFDVVEPASQIVAFTFEFR